MRKHECLDVCITDIVFANRHWFSVDNILNKRIVLSYIVENVKKKEGEPLCLIFSPMPLQASAQSELITAN